MQERMAGRGGAGQAYGGQYGPPQVGVGGGCRRAVVRWGRVRRGRMCWASPGRVRRR